MCLSEEGAVGHTEERLCANGGHVTTGGQPPAAEEARDGFSHEPLEGTRALSPWFQLGEPDLGLWPPKL